MTRPQITGTLDLNMSYSVTPTAINEEYMTAWFRFEEGSRERKLSPIMVGLKVLLAEMAETNLHLPGKFGGAVEFSSMTNGFLPMLLPIPWKSGKQSQAPFQFGLSLISSHIGDLDQITIIGILVCTGWVQRMLALVLPVMGGDLEGFLVVVWEVITTTKIHFST